MSESTVQQWEEGRTRIPASRLWQMCKLLDLDVPEVFERQPHHVETPPGDGVVLQGSPYVRDDGRGRKVVAVARAAAKLPDDRLALAVELLKALKPKL